MFPTHGPAGPTISGLRSSRRGAPMFLIVFVISSARTVTYQPRMQCIFDWQTGLTLAKPDNTLFTMCAVSVQKASSNSNSLGTKSNRLHHVCTRSNTAIHHNFDFVEEIRSITAQLIKKIYRCRGTKGLSEMLKS